MSNDIRDGQPHDAPAAKVPTPVLGEDRETQLFDTAEAARGLVCSMVAQGRHSARLFTRDLDSLLYDNAAFAEGLSRLLRISPRSHARVLVQNPENFAAQDHRLVALSQVLSSYLELRVVPKEAKDELAAFLVIDEAGYLYRPNSALYEGDASYNDPRRVRDLGHQFEQWWQQGSALTAARRLHL